MLSTLDLVGPGLTLLVGPAGAAWHGAAWHAAGARVPSPAPPRIHDLDALSARGLGPGPAGAVLTRPDAAPAGCWPCDHDAEQVLRAAIGSLRSAAGTSAAMAASTSTATSTTRRALASA